MVNGACGGDQNYLIDPIRLNGHIRYILMNSLNSLNSRMDIFNRSN